MDNVDNFIHMISNVDIINKVDSLLNTYNIQNCAKIYLSSLFVLYFPNFQFEVDDTSYSEHPLYIRALNLVTSTKENLKENIEKYNIELEKWKQIDLKEKSSNLSLMSEQINQQKENIPENLYHCYEIQLKILDIAKDYFEKKKMK